MPERDVRTGSGKRLTLVTPAEMTRQVYRLGEGEHGLKGHITSLTPLNPRNRPDAWEAAALRTIKERGADEVSSIEVIDGVEYMRLMRPLYIEKQCLGCHVSQGYAIGEIAGGICVSVPMAPLWETWRTYIRSDRYETGGRVGPGP